MTRTRALLTCSIAALSLMAGSVAFAQSAQGEFVPNKPNTSNVTKNDPGYQALKDGDLRTAGAELRQSHAEQPNDAFAELNLGAVYQRQGRMELAEPLLRDAMTHGHRLMPVDYTNPRQRGMTVEEIACANLMMGLPSAPAGREKVCQTTLTVALLVSRGQAVAVATEFNTYFEFNKDVLTEDGRRILVRAVRKANRTPGARVTLVGHASRIGTADHNADLAERRSITVRNAMIAAGLDPARIDTSATGESDAPVKTVDGAREPLNRVVTGTIEVPVDPAKSPN